MVIENQCYPEKIDYNRWNPRILVKHNQWKNLKHRSMLEEQNQRKNVKKSVVGGAWEEINYGILVYL